MPCYSPLKGWKNPDTGGIVFRRNGAREKMEVACGQCLGCRLDRSRMWAMRIVHESSLHELDRGNSFITLTYRDRSECTEDQIEGKWYVPDDWSLHKEHFQKFMKRLRKATGDKIKYFHCGEYGSKCKHGLELGLVDCPLCNVGRPHYHACMFNYCPLDLVEYAPGRFTSPSLEKIWKYGFVDVGELNFASAAYVARYILKKITGPKADDHYMQCDIDGVATWVEPEYCTMSNGIGKDWFDKYKSDVFPSDEVPVPGVGVLKKVPRYYEEIWKNEAPMSMEEIKAVRQKFREEHGDEYTPERLMAKYKVKKAQVNMLKREHT